MIRRWWSDNWPFVWLAVVIVGIVGSIDLLLVVRK